MPEDAIASILKSHKLRITDCRIDVIQHFIEEKFAFSQRDLENRYKQYDRVTIYRTLNSLLQAGILHKIPSRNGSATYGLSHYSSDEEYDNDNHVHFKCDDCGKIQCLKDIEVPKVCVPEGYTVKRVNVIIDGVCIDCAC